MLSKINEVLGTVFVIMALYMMGLLLYVATKEAISQPTTEHKIDILCSIEPSEKPEIITLPEETEIAAETVEPPSDVAEETTLLSIPSIASDMHLYTDYRAYNITGSPSYRLQQKCYTDEYGCRRFGEDYVIGLGTFYSTDIGDRFEITLDNGNTFTAILGDNKADRDTDVTNRYTECVNYDGEPCANILEFIVDTDLLSERVKELGTLTYYDHFDGNVTAIKYLGRDESEDWSVYY